MIRSAGKRATPIQAMKGKRVAVIYFLVMPALLGYLGRGLLIWASDHLSDGDFVKLMIIDGSVSLIFGLTTGAILFFADVRPEVLPGLHQITALVFIGFVGSGLPMVAGGGGPEAIVFALSSFIALFGLMLMFLLLRALSFIAAFIADPVATAGLA